MRLLIIKILFKLIKLPIASNHIDFVKKNEWLGLQWPVKSFHDLMASKNLHLLQMLGEGLSQKEWYWINVGRRLELGSLYTEAKINFDKAETERKKKIENENTKNK